MCSSPHSKLRLYRRLSSYLTGYWSLFFITIFAMIVVAATGPIFTWLLKPLIDEGFVVKNIHAMRWIPWAIIGIFALRGIANFINEYTSSYLSSHLVKTIRLEMFHKLVTLPASFFHNNGQGRTISRIISDANQISEAGFNVITILAKDGVTVLALLSLLLYLNWQLTIITIIVLPIIGLCMRWVSKRLRKLAHSNQEYVGKMTQTLSESIDGIKIVKVYNGQDYEKQRFENSAHLIQKNLITQSIASALNTGLTQLLFSITLALILYFSALKAAQNTFSTGDFVTFLSSMIMMFDPIKRMTNIVNSLQRGFAAAESVFSFLDEKEETDHGTLTLSKQPGDIIFDHVHFQYPDHPNSILNQFNLTIPQGKITALVGESGCGKTTLIHLILRFFDINSGSIQIDGIDTRQYTLQSLRSRTALVSQDIVLFNDTIARNIAYGCSKHVPESEIIQAAKAANAWSFIEKLPKGIHTHIGENGLKLSGGQRQRLAIARALLKDAPILILDEATSALDTESERLVQSALENLMIGRTTIIVAHRLSTIEKADKIVVMHQGKIVEQGQHQQLLNQKSRYADLYALQFLNKPK